MINPTEYINAVISRAFKDESLMPVYRAGSNMLHFESGNNAFVFKVKSEATGKSYAIKLYTDPDNVNRRKISQIATYIKQLNSPYMINYDFDEAFIYVDIEDADEEDKIQPAVIMEWVEGMTLGKKVKELCINKDYIKLHMLVKKFRKLALFIMESDFAHGDLKHDNIIVDDNFDLKLIDYDGMYIPAFAGQKSTELGTRSFQHPARTTDDFNDRIDDFSILTIYTSLVVLAKYPDFYTEFEGEENLLFRYKDYLNPEQSDLFKRLEEDELCKKLSKVIKESLRTNYIRVDNIDDVLNIYVEVALRKILLDKVQSLYEQLSFREINSNAILQDNIIKVDELSNSLFKQQKSLVKDFLIRIVAKSGFTSRLISYHYALGEELIDKYKSIWNWGCLSVNDSLPWSEDFVEKYEDMWIWDRVPGEIVFLGNLSINRFLPWSEKLIEKYEDKWSWEWLSRNSSIPWTLELLEKYKDKWDWGNLGGNNGLPWSEELIEKYKHKWDWSNLSKNDGLPWSEELIDKYIDRWDFDFYGLCSNEGIQLTDELINKYKEYWGTTPYAVLVGRSSRSSVKYSPEITEKFLNMDKFDFSVSFNSGLNMDEKFPWFLELIEKNEDILNYYNSHSSKALYKKVFKKHLDDEMVDDIMKVVEERVLEWRKKRDSNKV